MPAKIHKKTSPSSGSKESFAKQMISFIENKTDTKRSTICLLFETMSQIDLMKISISKLRNSTVLYIKTLNELMKRINENKIVFRIAPVVLCAQMIAETARIFSQSSGISIDIFTLLLNNDQKITLPSEDDIPPFPVRKIQKIHSQSPLFAFIIQHYPQAGNVVDIFCYALATMLERMKLKILIPRIIPSFSTEKYTPVPHQKFSCSEVTPESLLEIAKQLTSPMDPVLTLLVRFITNKIFGFYDYHYMPINELLDTAFEFIEDDPDYKIDSLTPLLLYYSSNRVNFPIHLTYTNVNHCLFLICIGLRNLFEPTKNDILISTISFDNAPCPSLALVFAHNLTESFISEFITHTQKIELSLEWQNELKNIIQYVKLPPKREDLIEQSKTNDIDAIKFLLKDPECVPLLKPDEFQSHKLLLLFLKPIEQPLPEKINFDRYDAAFIYRLRSLKKQVDEQTISNYIRQSAEELNKITLEVCKNDKSSLHVIYSGLHPFKIEKELPVSPQVKKITSAEFFFSPPSSPEFENISIIIDNLLTIIYTFKFDFNKDQEIIQIVSDFNHHYYLALNHSSRCLKVFGDKYREAYESQPYDHFIKAFKAETEKDKQSKLISLFRSIISSPTSHSCMINFIKNCYDLKNQETFVQIIKIMPSVISFDSSTTLSNEELLDIIRILINAEISKNVIEISSKLIENNFSKQLYKLFLSESFKHPEVMTSICHNLPYSPEFAEYFFNNSLDNIPNEIESELSNLIFYLSKQIKPSDYELPSYPKLKINDIEWKEDKLKKNAINSVPKTEIGEEIIISVEKDTKSSKIKKCKKNKKLDNDEDLFEEEEEEEEEDFIDDELDNCITITNSTASSQNYEFSFSSKNCPSIWEIPNTEHCTFIDSGPKYVNQPFFKCLTCNFKSNEGVCEYCAIHCHKGHQIYYDSTNSCFCDCFADAKRCISNPDHKHFAHSPHHQKPSTFGKTSTFGKPSTFGMSWKGTSYNNNNNNNITTINQNKKTKIALGSKCIIDQFLKISRTKFVTFEIDDLRTFQLKQLKTIRGFNQFNLSPCFSFPSPPSYSQLKKRIIRVKNLSLLLEKRSNFKPISIACNIGNDTICYTNGSGLFVTDIPSKSSPRTGISSRFGSSSLPSTSCSSLPFDECIYSIIPSGDSLVACLCDSVVKIVKITKNDENNTNEQQQQPAEQQAIAHSVQQPPPQQIPRFNNQSNQQQSQQPINQSYSQNGEIQEIIRQINQLQLQIQNQSNQNQPVQTSQIRMLSLLNQHLNDIQSQNRNQVQNRSKYKFEVIASLTSHTTAANSPAATPTTPSPSAEIETSTIPPPPPPPPPPPSNVPKYSFYSSTSNAPTYSFSSLAASPQRSSIFIDAIFIDNSFIIILTASSITVYSLPSGTQLSCINASLIPFTSMALFMYKEQRYILSGNTEGKLNVYLLSQQGILTLDHTVGIDWPITPVIVSYSKEDDLVFISSDRHPLSVCRSSGLFSATLSPITINIITSTVSLSGRYIDTKSEEENEDKKQSPPILFFTKTKNGLICTLEFTASSFIVSTLNDEFTPEDISQPTLLGSFDSSMGYYALSTEGIMFNILINKNRMKMIRQSIEASFDDDQEFNMNDANSELRQDYSVPVSFWSRSISESRDYVNLYSDEMDDASTLLSGRTINVPPSSTLRFTANPINNDYTIVGIRIFTMISPSSSSYRCVEANGRSYQLGSSMSTCIALRPDEVHPGAPVKFTIMPGYGIMILKRIKIHCMRTDQLTVPRVFTPKKAFNWMTDSIDIFDFCEKSLNDIPKDDQKAQIEVNLARGFYDDGTIDEDYIRLLILIMYECGNEVALQARFILVKLKFDHDLMQKIWADSIAEVVKKKTLHKSQINALWRDFTLLDSKFKGEIQNLVWNNVQEQSGLSCLLSAFY